MLYRLRDQALTPRGRGRREGRRRIAGGFGVSLLLHAVILAALLVRLKWQPEPEPLPPPAPVSMIFEGGRPQGPSSPEPTLLPGSELSRQQPSLPQQSAAPPAAPPPAAAPPQPEATPPPPPETAQREASPAPPPLEQAPSEVTVPPMPPVPPPPQPAKSSPPSQTWPPVRQAAPARPPSDFPAPMDFSLGAPPAKSDSTGFGKPLLSLTLPRRGPADPTPYSLETDADVGADWRNALSAWVESHSYYPSQAAELGQQGTARVLVTTMPDGRVTAVELEHGSGSPWLDLALEGLFLGAHLPPLPKSAGDQPVPFHFTMHYILLR